jgi:hypothetical protein
MIDFVELQSYAVQLTMRASVAYPDMIFVPVTHPDYVSMCAWHRSDTNWLYGQTVKVMIPVLNRKDFYYEIDMDAEAHLMMYDQLVAELKLSNVD